MTHANVPKTLTLAVVIGLALTAAPGWVGASRQSVVGEISGQISDADGGVIPGATVTAEYDGQRRETATDGAGRFALRALPLGTFRVEVKLSGFITRTGTITLTTAIARAHVVWKLEIDCRSGADQIIDYVYFTPRDAAKMVDFILHARVTSDNGAMSWSTGTECTGGTQIYRTYSFVRLAAVPVPRSANLDLPAEIIMRPPVVPLVPGREYLMLFSRGGLTDGNLVVPVVNGRIPANADKDLAGMTVAGALEALARWSRQRP